MLRNRSPSDCDLKSLQSTKGAIGASGHNAEAGRGFPPLTPLRQETKASQPRSARMATSQASDTTIGLEEEMFLVDAETLACVPHMPERFESEARHALGDRFEREMIASIVELVSTSHTSMRTLKEEIAENRHTIARIAARHGLAVMACGTHPFSAWSEQTVTDGGRYRAIAEQVQMPSLRAHACGLHVHVAVPAEHRIRTMSRIRPYLPLFLALSTSSPFWGGRPTGLKSYRTAVNNEFPRSGLPPPFRSSDDYDRTVRAMKNGGIVPDESFLWWAIRPSAHYPTLELRVTDSCTRIDDAIAIAGLYRALVHHLVFGAPDEEADATGFDEVLIEENRWQAARHGIDARFLALDSGGSATVMQVLRSMIAATAASLDALACRECASDALRIVTSGASADRQLTVHADSIGCRPAAGDAANEVARFLVAETTARLLATA